MTETTDPWGKAYQERPLNPKCDREIEIAIVGKRCVYINDHRVQGSKPYVSKNLSWDNRKTTLREIFDAFSVEDIHAYLEEKIAINAYCSGLRNYRDAFPKEKSNAS